ncbi:DUF397 domain-containing protein [Streptomyces sp. NPDC053560]|uniref:DUF397 domain-containing protein n=1 Tax=Streptomyces sp. NPDC053560 TaxID=3365711 RepID=UPI0037D7BB63
MSTTPISAGAHWRKSSYSGDTGGECVEIVELPARVAIRDSKDPHGPALVVAPAAFAAFVAYVGRGARP